MNAHEFSPRETMELVLSRWWIVLLLTILGGIGGWVYHMIHPPLYESTASITIVLTNQDRKLTNYQVDKAINGAGSIITSSEVMDALNNEAVLNDLSAPVVNRIRDNSSVETTESVWKLHARDRDPVLATKYVNLWASIAEEVMNESLTHALLAIQLQNQMDNLRTCFPFHSYEYQTTTTQIDCKLFTAEEITAYLQVWANEMADEQELSQGVLPITSISINKLAETPEEPVIFKQSNLVLAGVFIGFIISLWITSIPRIRRHD